MKETRTIRAIAREIYREWGEKISPHALPYLQAMSDLESIEDAYFNDSAAEIVIYFLSNATTWRGEAARRIKNELKDMVRSTGYRI